MYSCGNLVAKVIEQGIRPSVKYRVIMKSGRRLMRQYVKRALERASMSSLPVTYIAKLPVTCNSTKQGSDKRRYIIYAF